MIELFDSDGMIFKTYPYTHFFKTPILLFMDLICFSHLRWNFVYQRPQHLMSRASKTFRVFYFEEPLLTSEEDHIDITTTPDDVKVIVPKLQDNHADSVCKRLSILLERLIIQERITDYMFWYYTPMMLSFSEEFSPKMIVYDCMDQLSAFKGANAQMLEYEKMLLNKADVVFTGGPSLYRSKKELHTNIHCFPSSIDFEHFARARQTLEDPADQKNIPFPRFGFYGVIDERFDLDLLQESATLRPDLHFIILGPVVKIDEQLLPRNKNIHYLGMKSYQELPQYISNWDGALLLFALNESTEFISPTKTPEYLAAGLPVISTAVQDVKDVYGEAGLVSIVYTAEELVGSVDEMLKDEKKMERRANADSVLRLSSWDKTWSEMKELIITNLSNTKNKNESICTII